MVGLQAQDLRNRACRVYRVWFCWRGGLVGQCKDLAKIAQLSNRIYHSIELQTGVLSFAFILPSLTLEVLVLLLMIEILHYLKNFKLWELWYILYSG